MYQVIKNTAKKVIKTNTVQIISKLLVTGLLFNVNPAFAEQESGFVNVSVNYWDWSQGTQERSGKKSFSYVGAEAGGGYDWGDVYGFLYLQNPAKGDFKADQAGQQGADQFRIEAKTTVNINISDSNWNWYGDIFNFSDSAGGYEQNLIAGLSYEVNTDSGFWIRPFLGAHYVHNSDIGAGFNGVMTGWALGYTTFIDDHKLTFFNWNEIELLRADEYAAINGDTTGLNGAASVWYHYSDQLSFGIQYRYAKDKLGANTYQNGFIYTTKYNF
ncbi:outer membrane protein OmpK [Thalassomonas actiniarum]|uniref:Ion channel protein Tsx n=1 Tax=Thalassomonas actiniarum TaxID=485447 RepID=A0AAE9YH02_9GAMM|nr:outer membrane protein OmpK [Thalassomonas actiniarum]WDD96589.1 ion channel protein Tsx [Thalassomonas actiniarum]